MEYIAALAIVTFAPDLGPVGRFDQAECQTQPSALAAHRAFDEKIHVGFRRPLFTHHRDFGVSAQAAEQSVPQPFGQKRRLLVSGNTEVPHNQCVIRLTGRNRSGAVLVTVLARNICAAAGIARTQFKYADRMVDVLQHTFAAVDKWQIEVSPHLFVDLVGYAYTRRLRDFLQPRRDIDALSEEVFAVNHDVAQIDADTEPHTLQARTVAIARGNFLLELGSAQHRRRWAGELGNQRISCTPEKPAFVCAYAVFNQAKAGLQSLQRTVLVPTHHVGKCDNVGGENGG